MQLLSSQDGGQAYLARMFKISFSILLFLGVFLYNPELGLLFLAVLFLFCKTSAYLYVLMFFALVYDLLFTYSLDKSFLPKAFLIVCTLVVLKYVTRVFLKKIFLR
jgi:hypothetical protein